MKRQGIAFFVDNRKCVAPEKTVVFDVGVVSSLGGLTQVDFTAVAIRGWSQSQLALGKRVNCRTINKYHYINPYTVMCLFVILQIYARVLV